jgi:hypothetical protein|tara:strand:+ start:443 stop:625 length:183 start_codon:yes stop_codon:yes gene_type:complete
MFDFAKIFLAMVCAGSAVILFNMGYEFMDTGYGLNPLVAFPGMTVLLFMPLWLETWSTRK